MTATSAHPGRGASPHRPGDQRPARPATAPGGRAAHRGAVEGADRDVPAQRRRPGRTPSGLRADRGGRRGGRGPARPERAGLRDRRRPGVRRRARCPDREHRRGDRRPARADRRPRRAAGRRRDRPRADRRGRHRAADRDRADGRRRRTAHRRLRRARPDRPRHRAAEPSGALPAWHADFVDEVRRRLGVPVLLENEANLAAVAEQRVAAAGPDGDTFVLLWIGSGVGAGVMLDGRLRRGVSGGAGEVGFLPISPDGALPSAEDCDKGYHGLVGSRGCARWRGRTGFPRGPGRTRSRRRRRYGPRSRAGPTPSSRNLPSGSRWAPPPSARCSTRAGWCSPAKWARPGRRACRAGRRGLRPALPAAHVLPRHRGQGWPDPARCGHHGHGRGPAGRVRHGALIPPGSHGGKHGGSRTCTGALGVLPGSAGGRLWGRNCATGHRGPRGPTTGGQGRTGASGCVRERTKRWGWSESTVAWQT